MRRTNTSTPSPALTFRLAAGSSDAARLQPLVQSAYRGDSSRRGWTSEADLLDGERITTAGILEKMTAPGSAVLMAFLPPADTDTNEDGDLLACCEIVRLPPPARRAYFGMFAVDPERQAGGYGRQVLTAAETFARREWGAEVMEMSVIWTRKELISWYERRGYRVTGERREFPYEDLEPGVGKVGDLHFEVLEKGLVGGKGEVGV
ncbi:acetyltransferase [Schizothecium vesticola]|uniref:Acetyltransferase n=1 Tax=Schizothecium vesticola TaxID=314040 RepID=A0AA40KBC4_9PEZI|nr:acetyltransferase [Schizothecium vesticola]